MLRNRLLDRSEVERDTDTSAVSRSRRTFPVALLTGQRPNKLVVTIVVVLKTCEGSTSDNSKAIVTR